MIMKERRVISPRVTLDSAIAQATKNRSCGFTSAMLKPRWHQALVYKPRLVLVVDSDQAAVHTMHI
jgi:hypothetical protein